MKKMLVGLLTLAIVGGLYAIDLPGELTITGEVKTGLQIFSQDDGVPNGRDTYGKGWNDDAGENFRGRLNLGWEGDVGGTKFRLQAVNGADVTLAKAFGWVNLFDKKIVIWGGQGVDDIYGVGGIVDDNVDAAFYSKFVSVTGTARVEVRPIEGLSIAFGLPLPIDGAHASVPNIFGNSRIGAKYGNDFITVIASFRLNSDPAHRDTIYDNNGHHEVTDVDGKEDLFLDAVYGVKLPNLGPVNLDITGAFETGDRGYFRVAPHVSLSPIEKLSVHARTDIDLILGDTAPRGPFYNAGYLKEPNDDASVGFRVGAGYQITDIIGAYLHLGSDNLGYFDGNGLYIKPGATFAFGPNTHIEIFDKINRIGADGKVSGDQNHNISNQIQVDFNWTF